MTFSPSPAARASVESTASLDAFLAFVTITHPNLAEPIRVVSDVMDYLWDGHLWIGVVFEVRPPDETDDPTDASITIPNTDLRVGEALRTVNDRAIVTLEVCTSADFDLSLDPREAPGAVTPVYPAIEYDLVEIDCSGGQLAGRLMLTDMSQEPWPGVFATADQLPGLHR